MNPLQLRFQIFLERLALQCALCVLLWLSREDHATLGYSFGKWAMGLAIRKTPKPFSRGGSEGIMGLDLCASLRSGIAGLYEALIPYARGRDEG